MGGWMDCELTSFLTVFHSSGRWFSNNERLGSTESRLRFKKFLSQRGSNPELLEQQSAL